MGHKALWAVVAAVALAALAWPARRAEASKVGRYSITLDGCVLPDGNQEAFQQADAAREIQISAEGTATLQCRGQVPGTGGYDAPSQAIRLDNVNTGAVCGTPFGTTLDWQAKVAPSGKVTMTCTIKAL